MEPGSVCVWARPGRTLGSWQLRALQQCPSPPHSPGRSCWEKGEGQGQTCHWSQRGAGCCKKKNKTLGSLLKPPGVPKSPGYQPRAGPSCGSCGHRQQKRALLGAFWHRPLQGIPKTTAQPRQRSLQGISPPPSLRAAQRQGLAFVPPAQCHPLGARRKSCLPRPSFAAGGSLRAASLRVSFLLPLLLHLQPQLSPRDHQSDRGQGYGDSSVPRLTQFYTSTLPGSAWAGAENGCRQK